MTQPGRSKSKATVTNKQCDTLVDILSATTSAHQPSSQYSTTAKKHKKTDVATATMDTDDDEVPPPAKKAKVDKSELQARQAKGVSPYLVEIARLKEQHVAEIKKLKERYKAEIRKLKDEDIKLQDKEEINELNEKHQAEIKSLKQEHEELKHIIQAQKTEIRIQEHLVQVGAAVRGRWFELAKSSAGVGQPVTTIVEAGERAITRGNIRADLAMLYLGYAALPSVQAAEAASGNLDPDSKYKDIYFKDLYTLSFSEFSEHLNDDLRSYPLKKLEICEMSGTMTSLTGFSATHKYEEKGLLNKFQALAIAADGEWAKHICHLWPDHQRRLNTANNWPPLEMIVREMRTIVEDFVESAYADAPATLNSTQAENGRAGSGPCNAMSSARPSTEPFGWTSASWSSPASNRTTSGTRDNA